MRLRLTGLGLFYHCFSLDFFLLVFFFLYGNHFTLNNVVILHFGACELSNDKSLERWKGCSRIREFKSHLKNSYSYILGNIVAYSRAPPWIFCSRAWGSGLLLASRWSNTVTLWDTKEEYSGQVGSDRIRLSLQNHVWFIENPDIPKWILITFCGRNFKNIILNYICNHCVIWLFWNWKNLSYGIPVRINECSSYHMAYLPI